VLAIAKVSFGRIALVFNELMNHNNNTHKGTLCDGKLEARRQEMLCGAEIK